MTNLHAKIALIKLRMFGGARRVTVPFVQIARFAAPTIGRIVNQSGSLSV